MANLPQSQFGTFIPSRLALADSESTDPNFWLNCASKIIVHRLHPSVLQAYIAHPCHNDLIKSVLQHIMDEHYTAQPATSKHAATPKMQIFTSVNQTSKSFSEGTWYFITNICILQ
jgi:hypothetical protein